MPSPTLKPFRFYAMWMEHTDFEEFINAKWEGETDADLVQKLAGITPCCERWNKEVFGGLFAKKRRLLARLSSIQKAQDRYSNYFLKNLSCELEEGLCQLLIMEEQYWRQKSRVKWLQVGDRNSAFFHLSTLIRRRKNKMEGILNQNGLWVDSKQEVQDVAVQYFN